MFFRIAWICFCVGLCLHPAQALTFTVNVPGDQSAANPGDGTGEIVPDTGLVTLRSAIEEANLNNGPHTITIDADLVTTITPITALPAIGQSNVTIRGGGALLDGSLVSSNFDTVDGLVLVGQACEVENLRIANFPGNGIRVTDVDASGGAIRGCTIGSALGGGNRDAGILLESGVQDFLIGGPEIRDGNVIAGNGRAGIQVTGATTELNGFQRNRIFENGAGPRGIVIENDAQRGVKAPVIESINPVRGTAPPNAVVDLFVDRGSEAEVYVATVRSDGDGEFEANLDLRDFTAKPPISIEVAVPFTRFLTATATDALGNTSAISNAVLIRGEAAEEARRLRHFRSIIGTQNFTPGGTLEVFLTTDVLGDFSSSDVEIVEVLPEGWTLAANNSSGAEIVPSIGSGPVLRWVFFGGLPEDGQTFGYTVNVSPDSEGSQFIEGLARVFEPQARKADANVGALGSPLARSKLLEDGFTSIIGRVLDFATDTPIACATVEYVRLDEPGPVVTAVVDNNGRFEFPNLAKGLYLRRVLAPGYATAMAPEVSVTAALSSLEIKLSLAPPSPALVRGQVTDADSGLPLGGVFVLARQGNNTFGTTYSCASGLYEIPRPESFPKGDGTPIDVEFSADNYDSESQSVDVPDDEAAVANQGLSKSSLFPSALVGLVSASDTGNTPEGAQVLLEGPVNTTASVGSTGAYTFDAILDGTYLVRANAPGFEPAEKTKTVQSGVVETLNFALTPIPLAENPFDINGDGAVNALDVQLVINAALGIAITPFNADVNASGNTDAVDVQLVINAALGIG